MVWDVAGVGSKLLEFVADLRREDRECLYVCNVEITEFCGRKLREREVHV